MTTTVMTMIVTSKAKAYAKDKHDIRLGTDFLEELNGAVRVLIDVAGAEARQDKRGTVKKRDLRFQDPRAR